MTTYHWSFNAPQRRGAIGSEVVMREIAIAELAGEALRPVVLDMLEVISAVQAADRMTKRPSPNGCGVSWSRRLDLLIGVRDPARWSNEGVRAPLEHLLSWLTDDDWTLRFTQRSGTDRLSESVNLLFGLDPDVDCVSLFSGGLDSVMGLAIDIAEGRSPIAVSAVSNTRMRKSQQETIRLLERAFDRFIPRVEVRFNLRRERSIENTQRSRGLGFVAMAAATADALDLETIRVYENGVGAINLPYLSSQVGAHGTRSMHPATLRLAADLFSTVLDRELVIENPHVLHTKAEMCALTPEVTHPAMAAARSCDSAFTNRRRPQPWNCGSCTSCLLRRQSLIASGLESVDGDSYYASDFVSSEWMPVGVAPAHRPVEVMLAQAARLRAATASEEPVRALIEAFPDVALVASSGPGGRHIAPRHLVQMYARYAEEWASIPCAAVQTFLPSAKSSSEVSIGGVA